MFIAPATVIPPATAVSPIVRLPVVIAARSVATSENVPPVPPTEMDLTPFGFSTVWNDVSDPENVMSLAVMVVTPPDVEMEVEAAFVTLPVPSVVMFTLPEKLVTLAFNTIFPLEPDDVCNVTPVELESVLEAVMLPLAVSVRVPVVAVITPEVPILAEAPVVVTEKLLPTVDVPRVTAPVLVMKAEFEFTVIAPAAVVIGIPTLPILPVAVRLNVPDVEVIVPEVVILEDTPVVVMEKLPPTVEVATETLPLLLT